MLGLKLSSVFMPLKRNNANSMIWINLVGCPRRGRGGIGCCVVCRFRRNGGIVQHAPYGNGQDIVSDMESRSI